MGNSHIKKTGAIIAAAKDAADMRRRMGAAALEMDAASDGSAQAQWRATVAARLPSQRWPQQPMLIVAVDANTGEPVVFDRDSGVELAATASASCANGFGVPPYTIGWRRYIDGGYRANENADLAAGYAGAGTVTTRRQITAPVGLGHPSRSAGQRTARRRQQGRNHLPG